MSRYVDADELRRLLEELDPTPYSDEFDDYRVGFEDCVILTTFLIEDLARSAHGSNGDVASAAQKALANNSRAPNAI